LAWISPTPVRLCRSKSLRYDTLTAFDPVSLVATAGLIMVTRPDFPAGNVKDLVAQAKANPGKINMSTPGIGSINHVAGELFNMMAGVDRVPVHYRSSQFPDLLSGQVQVTFNPLPSSLEFIKSGKLRALAVTSATRQAVLPEPQPLRRRGTMKAASTRVAGLPLRSTRQLRLISEEPAR